MLSKYSIKDLERISGIKAHTLRIWEQRYEILHPERTDTNIRFYTNSDLKRILNISLLNNNGFKISNIARLNNDQLVEEVDRFLNGHIKESDQVENLVLCLMDLDESRFEKTISNSVEKFGFENTIEKIIFPFLRHMGNMWQLGVISPAQEHYISNLIRQKIITGINDLTPIVNESPKKYIFFLPQLEMHELGLLYAHYLTKLRGHKCFYLGQSVPVEDLAGISDSVKPDFIVSILTAKVSGMEINSFLNSCNEKVPGPVFLLSGRLLLGMNEKYKIPSKRFKLFENFEAYKEFA